MRRGPASGLSTIRPICVSRKGVAMAGEDDWDAIKERIDGMDEDGLRMTIGIMAHKLGLNETSKAIDIMLELRGGAGTNDMRTPTPDEIHRKVRDILQYAPLELSEFCDIDDDESDSDVWSFDRQNLLVREKVEEEFDDLCREVLAFDGEEEVGKIVHGIAEALRDRDIPWKDTSEDLMEFRRMFADAIEERFRNGEFGELFGDIDRW